MLKGKKMAGFNSTGNIGMKGAICPWVLATVLSGAIVGLLGFVVEAFFRVKSSVMAPVIIGAIAASWRFSLRLRSSETGNQISRSKFCLELRPAFQPITPGHRTRHVPVGLKPI
jgi:hypothetical protein